MKLFTRIWNKRLHRLTNFQLAILIYSKVMRSHTTRKLPQSRIEVRPTTLELELGFGVRVRGLILTSDLDRQS